MNPITLKRYNPITIFIVLTLLSCSRPAHAELKNGMAADVVIGQKDFNSSASGCAADKLNAPRIPYSNSNRLIISDPINRRVLIFNSIPTSNGASADIVVGQTDFISNSEGRSATKISRSWQIYSDGKRLFIGDWENYRILIFNAVPTQNGAAADVVVGQADMTNRVSAVTRSNSQWTNGIYTDGTRLWFADMYDNRVLMYNSIPAVNGAPADIVIGQADFTSGFSWIGSGCTKKRFCFPTQITSDGQKLLITDTGNHRVLVYNTIPTQNDPSADVVIGQQDFTSNQTNQGQAKPGSNTMGVPESMCLAGGRLFICDPDNNRVLVYDSIPTANNAPADYVIGQPDFTSSSANQGRATPGPDTLKTPYGIFFDGKRLLIGDSGNNRVLIYNIGSSSVKLGPQFEQGKALIGKVFNDVNGNGIQDTVEKGTVPTLEKPLPGGQSLLKPNNEQGLEGVKVVSDTGIYAITDSDGKYHFPYIEVGQHLLKIDESTLPEGSTITTDNPYHVTVTEGVLTKVSFGVRLLLEPNNPTNPNNATNANNEPLLKVSVSQDPVMLKPRLSISHKIIQDKGTVPTSGKALTWGTVPSDESIEFTITCNYYLFIAKSNIKLYDKDYNLIKTIDLPNPIPSKFTLPLSDIIKGQSPPQGKPLPGGQSLYYQLSVYDKNNNEDRTGIGSLEIQSQ